MKRKYIIIFFILIIPFIFNTTFYPQSVSADQLSDSIQQNLENLDLSKLEDFYNSVKQDGESDFTTLLNSVLKGECQGNYENFFDYIINIVLKDVKESLPVFLSVIAIAVLCCILQNLKGSFFTEGVGDVIYFVCILSIVLILSTKMLSIWSSVKNIIQNITNLSNIMSPIILTLMVASGGKVSAAIYKPTVLFLTNGIINVFTYIVLPLVGVMVIFTVLNCLSGNFKFNKFSDFITSLIKWIIGLTFTIYGIFISVQGISSSTFDGISVKAAKYAISNSIPLIGGYLKEGFDLVIAGSVIIKNAIGVIGIFSLFYMLIAPILHYAVFSLLLKLTAAFAEPLLSNETSALCMGFSKGISYIITCVLAIGFMLFITVLLMIFSANAFV